MILRRGAGSSPYPTVDESQNRLWLSGWSVGETALSSIYGAVWLVTGSNGENRIETRGRSQAEVWHRACEQAAAVGMLSKSQSCDESDEQKDE
jgi:hypothetical protein